MLINQSFLKLVTVQLANPKQQSLKIGAPTIQERTPEKENNEMGNFDVTKIPGDWITRTKIPLSIINIQV